MEAVHRITEVLPRCGAHLRGVELEREAIVVELHGVETPGLRRGERGTVGEGEQSLAVEVERGRRDDHEHEREAEEAVEDREQQGRALIVTVEAGAHTADHRPLPPVTAVLVFEAKRDSVCVAVPSRGTLVARLSERNSGTSGNDTLAETVTRTRSSAARQSPIRSRHPLTRKASMMTARLSSLRLLELAKTAAEAPTLPTSLDRLDPATAERLEAFVARERLTLTASLDVVRDAQKAARTELRADARVEAAVSTALQRRRLGLVGVVSIDASTPRRMPRWPRSSIFAPLRGGSPVA